MTKLLIIIASFQMLIVNSCSKTEVAAINTDSYEGNWVLKNVFLGDVVDTPCSYEVKEHRDLTLTISKEKESANLQLNGQSAVNTFFGNIKIESIDATSNIASIKVDPLGSTKIGGPANLMQCETRYYSLMSEAIEMRIENDMLYMGRFKKDPTPSRDGGTFLIFERKK